MGGPKNNWDNHTDIKTELPFIAGTVVATEFTYDITRWLVRRQAG